MSAPLAELAAADFTQGRCSRRRWDGTRLCSMDADLILTGMCVHEHMYETGYCKHHAETARSGVLACVECRYCAESHNCRVSVVDERKAIA